MRRVLAIDGGGVRGIVAIAFLERFEALIQKRSQSRIRLSDVFHLVGGTSTGAIVATALALGQSVSEIREAYLTRAAKVFRPSYDPRRLLGIKPQFDAALLEQEFVNTVGELTLGSPELLTYLAILVKRLDTGSAWVLSNIPSAPYFKDSADGTRLGNCHYRLSRLLRASTAVPSLFDPAYMEVSKGASDGLFIDGGFSPYNDPALAMLMLVRMRAYGLEWATGRENLSIVSIGNGALRGRISKRSASGQFPPFFAARSLLTMVLDGATQTRMLMQWLGHPLLPEVLNREIGDLAGETLAPEALFSYLRLDTPMEAAGLAAFGIELSEAELRHLRTISDPEAMPTLYNVATVVAERVLTEEIVDQVMGT